MFPFRLERMCNGNTITQKFASYIDGKREMCSQFLSEREEIMSLIVSGKASVILSGTKAEIKSSKKNIIWQISVEDKPDCKYNDFPTLGEIIEDFNNFILVLNECGYEKLHSFKLETENRENQIIVKKFGCLSDINLTIENNRIIDIIINVWSNKTGCCFICNSSIDNAITNYDTYLHIANMHY